MKRVIVKQNRYVDSVSLMRLSEQLLGLPGVAAAEVQMATPANCQALEEVGFISPAGLSLNDMVIAVEAGTGEALDDAVAQAEQWLEHGASAGEEHYHTLKEIAGAGEKYDLAQISLPGEYAAAEAREALDMGMDVFIFSDNVPLEQELELKRHGREKGLLVMGPDCGVGFWQGVCLGAGSIMAPGAVGIVGASGSGAQEVACIVEKCGEGISSIIGTGGHDLFPQIGGISMLAGLQRLEQDAATKVVVLVSKLADAGVMARVLDAADKCQKPVVACFLGAEGSLFAGHSVTGVGGLETAALAAVALLHGQVPVFGFSQLQLQELVTNSMVKLAPAQKYFRGLYCGGTFTEEALVYFNSHNPGVPLYTNLKNRYAAPLRDVHKSEGHTLLDLGAEDFTADAPHPVFDPEIRLRRFAQEVADESVAVILLDFITGPGVHEDPITPFATACGQSSARGKGPVFIATVCGSQKDPQRVAEKQALLQEAGVIVADSNYQAARLASALLAALTERG